MAEVEKANDERLAYWYRFLMADTPEHRKSWTRCCTLQRKRRDDSRLSEKIGYGGA